MTGRRRSARRLPVLLLAGVLVAGCGADRPADPTVPAGDVRADATQTRFDEVAVRRFEITLTDVGGAPFTVSSARLDSPGFGPAQVLRREDEFAPATRYDLPALYGAPRCGTAPTPAAAVVQVRRPGGRATTLRLPLHSEDGLLRRLQAAECDRLELARQVEVTLADALRDGPLVRAVVRVRRLTATAAITATELRDSKLFAFTTALPVRLPAGTAAVDVPTTVTAAGCYGHLLADVKQPYLFPVFLRFDDGPVRYIELATTDAQHETLQAMLRTACAGRTS